MNYVKGGQERPLPDELAGLIPRERCRVGSNIPGERVTILFNNPLHEVHLISIIMGSKLVTGSSPVIMTQGRKSSEPKRRAHPFVAGREIAQNEYAFDPCMA